MTRVSAPAISDGGIMVKRSMIPTRQNSSSTAKAAQMKLSWRMRTRTITRPAPSSIPRAAGQCPALPPLSRGGAQPSPSEPAAQGFVKQALIEQLAPIDRLRDLADGDDAVGG